MPPPPSQPRETTRKKAPVRTRVFPLHLSRDGVRLTYSFIAVGAMCLILFFVHTILCTRISESVVIRMIIIIIIIIYYWIWFVCIFLIPFCIDLSCVGVYCTRNDRITKPIQIVYALHAAVASPQSQDRALFLFRFRRFFSCAVLCLRSDPCDSRVTVCRPCD